jgi:biopolymer transport protein TolR
MGMDTGGGKGGVKSTPNVVPMIDIMLVLLIIFMIVTPIISTGFQAQMPQGKNLEKRPDEDGDVILGVDKTGGFFLDPGTGQISPIAKDRLESFLTDVYSKRATNKVLYFKADANLEFAKVAEAIEIVRKAGVRVLAAVTEETKQPLTFGAKK